MNTLTSTRLTRAIALIAAPAAVALAVAVAAPASAIPSGGVMYVSPGSAAGSLTVGWKAAGASSTYFLGVADSSTGIADCNWSGTWTAYPDHSKVGNAGVYTASAGQSVESTLTSPIHGLWGGTMNLAPGGSYLVCLFNLSTGVGQPVLGMAGTGGTPLPDVVQQVGLPIAGVCDGVVDASLNWAGVPSGGWGKSWAQWAVASTGGPICSRVLHYDVNLGRFVIRP